MIGIFLVALPFAALFALLLLKGLATGRMPTYRGSVDRSRFPLLFWLTALIWVGAILFTLAMPVIAEIRVHSQLGKP